MEKTRRRSSPADQPSDTNQQIMIGSVMSMSWQLAVVVIVPLLAGFQLDSRLQTSPWFTLGGLIVTMLGMILVVRHSLADLNRYMSTDNPKKDTK